MTTHVCKHETHVLRQAGKNGTTTTTITRIGSELNGFPGWHTAPICERETLNPLNSLSFIHYAMANPMRRLSVCVWLRLLFILQPSNLQCSLHGIRWYTMLTRSPPNQLCNSVCAVVDILPDWRHCTSIDVTKPIWQITIAIAFDYARHSLPIHSGFPYLRHAKRSAARADKNLSISMQFCGGFSVHFAKIHKATSSRIVYGMEMWCDY